MVSSSSRAIAVMHFSIAASASQAQKLPPVALAIAFKRLGLIAISTSRVNRGFGVPPPARNRTMPPSPTMMVKTGASSAFAAAAASLAETPAGIAVAIAEENDGALPRADSASFNCLKESSSSPGAAELAQETERGRQSVADRGSVLELTGRRGGHLLLEPLAVEREVGSCGNSYGILPQ